MKVALVNPNWCFEGSIYFGCREPHLPLEYGYAQALLEARGHEALLIDGQLQDLTDAQIRDKLRCFEPDLTVVTTAPSYLFWRCPPPELRVAQDLVPRLSDVCGALVVVGPHASSTPRAALRKLQADAAILGECEEAIVELAETDRGRWHAVEGVACRDGGTITIQGKPRAVDMRKLPALTWPATNLHLHRHHHHRFETEADGPGAEIESSRGCPYACTFCAKQNYRDKFRKRPLETVLRELDALIAAGATYVYFIDEIFLPDVPLLNALVERDIHFGVQMRIDLFDHETIELLGRAGCVSIEAGVESITPEGRSLLAKRCRMSTEQLTDLLITAKRHVPFVQANLLDTGSDSPSEVAAWRAQLKEHGIWSNDPVPMFPYPGTPGYMARWGTPDDHAWERAHQHYLDQFERFSDIQERRPLSLSELEQSTHV